MKVIFQGTEGWCVLLIKPVSQHPSGGLHASDLDALAAPTLLAVEDGPSGPADFAFGGELDGASGKNKDVSFGCLDQVLGS